MSVIPNEIAQEENEIESIISDMTLTREEQEDKANATRQQKRTKKQESFEIIFNITNTMMGSALLVMPINYYKSGLLSSVIASLLVAIVSYKTSTLCVIHFKISETDLDETILRILGKRWVNLFNFMSMILLWLVGVIHFILMSNTLYSICKNIFVSDGWAEPSEITFKKFSLQYIGIIVFVICGFIFSLRNLKSILKLNDKGIYMIITFCIYIIYLGIYAGATLDLKFVINDIPGSNEGLNIVLFTSDIGTTFGVFALAYMIQNAISGIIKYSKYPQKNVRNIGFSFGLAFLLYSILGCMGVFAMAGLVHNSKDYKIPNTVMDVLVKSNTFLTPAMYIIGTVGLALIFLQLTTVIPILCFFTRRQFFGLIYSKRQRIPDKYFHLFNFAYNISSLALQMLTIDPSLVIGVSGAVFGFLLIYIIPIYMHLKCLYIAKEDLNLIEAIEACLNHSEHIKCNKYAVYLFYFVLTCFGVFLAVIQIIDLFK